jgi:hypothetical protein
MLPWWPPKLSKRPFLNERQSRHKMDFSIDALTLVRRLHLLMLCRLAVRLAHRRCPPLTYSEESLLLIALLRTRLPALL